MTKTVLVRSIGLSMTVRNALSVVLSLLLKCGLITGKYIITTIASWLRLILRKGRHSSGRRERLDNLDYLTKLKFYGIEKQFICCHGSHEL